MLNRCVCSRRRQATILHYAYRRPAGISLLRYLGQVAAGRKAIAPLVYNNRFVLLIGIGAFVRVRSSDSEGTPVQIEFQILSAGGARGPTGNSRSETLATQIDQRLVAATQWPIGETFIRRLGKCSAERQ